jgi:hypothetical protein
VRPAGEDGKPKVEIAIPVFGYKNHVSIDRAHGLIRCFAVTSAAAHDGARLPDVLDKTNTASPGWADTAHRSKANGDCQQFRVWPERLNIFRPWLG